MMGSLGSITSTYAYRHDPWETLREELRQTRAWYGGDVEVSAYVGVDSLGTYFGGVHVDGESLDEIEVEYRNSSDSDVAIELVRQLRAYRKTIDEMAVEEEEGKG